MKMLSKVSYLKIHLLSTRVEVRSTLNVLGLCSDERAERKNREDFVNVMMLTTNLNLKDKKKLENYAKKLQRT